MSKFLAVATLISITDGNAYDFADDGVEDVPGAFGEKRAKQKRQIIEASLRKTLKDGTPVYYAGERVVGKDGEVSWKPAKLKPQFPGDPLVELARPLDADVIKKIKANLEKRAVVHKSSLAVQGGELASFMERMLKAQGAAASVVASAPQGPSNG